MVTAAGRAGGGGAPVAVCTLSSHELARALAGRPGVARAGPLATANLGIEALVRAVVADPAIRFLLLCGADSVLFRPGQTLLALARHGVAGDERRVVGAEGYRPLLRGLRPWEIERFRAQVGLVDRRGVREVAELDGVIEALRERAPGPYPVAGNGAAGNGGRAARAGEPRRFRRLEPGGRRAPIASASGTFFVVDLDRRRREVVVRQYGADLGPMHEMRGVRAESMLLGLLRAGVVDEASHAGYLGAELAKAEAALRCDLPYVQDCPLRRPPRPAERPGSLPR